MAPEEFNDASLVQEFIVEADEYLRSLDDDLLALERIYLTDEAPDDLIENMFRATHTIKGLAAMFDFDDIKNLSHVMESVFQAFRKKERAVDEACLEVLFRGVDALRDALAAVSAGEGEVVGSARDAVRAIDALLDSVPVTENADRTPTGLAGLGEYAQARIAEAPDEGLRAVRLLLRWGIELRLGALRISAIERALGKGEVLEARPLLDDIPMIFEADSARTDVTFEVVALTDITDAEIGDNLGVSVSTIRTIAGTGDLQKSDAEVCEPTVAASAQHIIRVDIGRLDELMDLTGEIVTARTRLEDLVGEIKAANRKDESVQLLAGAAKDLSRLVDGLQDQVMRLRMVPVNQLFSKFHRTVRDIARWSGKEIQLVFEGEETELDKRLIEQVEETLLHMVRNACDHGIETPEERVAAGKPRQGTITLAAGHEGNYVFIETRDDGKGLDVGAIWNKAVEQGRISSDEEIGDALIVDIITGSGFSTAETITDISGRGVGMDIVRKKLAELGGTIQFETEFRGGTTFTMRLPLTLAIMSALLVSEEERAFAIPLASVAEVLRVDRGEIRTIKGSQVMDLRGHSLPVVDLGHTLGFEEEPSHTGKGFVVVVSGVGHRLGVLVDALVGQQQVVVKNLEETLGRTPGIGGATILGDGSVVPIIDVDGVVDLIAGRSKNETVVGGGVR
ncbi:MAG: chemotaxis protein CheA [Clostridiales bacterium]|nr:chemotaxis protein CheA [Clostridiales bacterium]